MISSELSGQMHPVEKGAGSLLVTTIVVESNFFILGSAKEKRVLLSAYAYKRSLKLRLMLGLLTLLRPDSRLRKRVENTYI